jgi:hypothetical protein
MTAIKHKNKDIPMQSSTKENIIKQNSTSVIKIHLKKFVQVHLFWQKRFQYFKKFSLPIYKNEQNQNQNQN